MKSRNVFANLDWITVGLFLVLIIFGWLSIFSAVYSEEHPNILDMNHRYGKQFLWICASIIIATIIMFIDQRFYDFFAYFIYGFAILLLLSVLVFGTEINGAKSWFTFGSFRIQPSEFTKPAVALALAKYLSGYNLNILKIRSFVVSAIIIFLPVVLIMLQPDAGSALVFFAFILPVYREGFSVNILLVSGALVVIFLLVLLLNNFLVIIILTGAGFIYWGVISRSFKNFFLCLAAFSAIAGLFFLIRKFTRYDFDNYVLLLMTMALFSVISGFVILVKRAKKAFIILIAVLIASVYSFSIHYAFENVLSDYQQRRVNVLLGFESDLQGAGYNVNQSKIAIGSGGFSGKGFLKGTQTKLQFVPEQSTDFIFCTVGEEWGFVGSIILISLFVSLLLRLLFLAERQRTSFSRIYGYGVLSVIFLHFFVNISMTIGLFPVIGIPLPFFSYGGSSLWAFTIMLFIFLRLDAGRKEHIR